MRSKRWTELLINVGNALAPAPWQLPRSIVGEPSSWSRTKPKESEFSLLTSEQWQEALTALWHATVPAWPGAPSGWQHLLPEALFRASNVDTYPRVDQPVNPWPNESWMFINGICTDAHVLALNARMLHRMFGRPLTLLHNQTSGIALDLMECALGKGWLHVTESVRKLFPAFLAELHRPGLEKLVLIAHSQGTIIASVFLQLLRILAGGKRSRSSPEACWASDLLLAWPPNGRGLRVFNPDRPDRFETFDHDRPQIGVHVCLDWGAKYALALPRIDRTLINKLEIYAFATCASDMRAIAKRPHIEHFGNEHDMVARLGVLAPRKGPGSVRIDGHCFERQHAWGHLLNAHYLSALEAQFQGSRPDRYLPRPGTGNRQSRLKQYWREARTVLDGMNARHADEATLVHLPMRRRR